jgi:hypothetical protein
MILGAANRDPERYPDPDRIDFTRTKTQPLSFGGGVHLCLGAPLARLEVEIVFRRLAERFAGMELVGELPPHRDRLTLRAPSAVPLKFKPAVTASGAPAATLGARPAGDDTAWRAEYRKYVEDLAATIDPAELDARIALLARVPLFAHCKPDDLATLAATAYPMSFDAGERLCAEGGDAPDCYVIAAGEAEVVKAGERVAVVGSDDVVGERGLLLGAPRAATVTATSHMITYAISRERLHAILDASPDTAAAMRDAVERRYN